MNHQKKNIVPLKESKKLKTNKIIDTVTIVNRLYHDSIVRKERDKSSKRKKEN